MDNAKIHHGQEVYDLLDTYGEDLRPYWLPRYLVQHDIAGVRVAYLPPYSPDLNPIEEAFSKIKAFIRRNRDLFAASPGSFFDMQAAMDCITESDALGYFMHAGYM
jgi:transposase